MTSTLIILTIAGAALLLAVALVLRSRARARAGDEANLARALADLNARMEQLASDVARVRGQEGLDERRTRALSELSGSIDLDEVLTRTLEAATNVTAVDAALVSVPGAGGEPILAALGLSDLEIDRAAITGPPDGSRPRAIRLSYVHDGAGSALRSALSVPLASDGEELGYLVAFSRRDDALTDAELLELESLAARAGPAIENARRYREARQLADLDALTGLHNRRYFHETLSREVARANRYERDLALVVLDLDDFKAINDRIGHLAGDAVLAEAAERIRDVVRSADVACRVGGDEFAIILPESAVADAEGLYRRLQLALAKRPVGQAGRLALSAGIAELRPEDDAVTFFERADEALYRAKDAGKGTVVLAPSEQPTATPPPATFRRSAPGTGGSS